MARPVIAAYIQQHGRSPGQKRFRRIGQGWIVSAAHKHYGGWKKTLQRMGFPQVVRVSGDVAGYRPGGYWMQKQNILRELQTEFPELLAWQIMPSTKMIQSKLMGLWSRASRTGGLGRLQRELRLYPYLVGTRLRQRVEDIGWVLDFYEAHGRWPHSVECPWRVRCRRFIRGISWHDYCRPPNLPAPGVLILIERFKRHRDWLKQNQPAKVLVRQRVLNHHIMDLYHRYPSLS